MLNNIYKKSVQVDLYTKLVYVSCTGFLHQTDCSSIPQQDDQKYYHLL